MNAKNRSRESIRAARETLAAGFVVAIVVLIVFGILCSLGIPLACMFEPTEKKIDPCVEADRGHQIICDGVPCGCTADPTNYRG